MKEDARVTGSLDFNHAMIYTADLALAREFYRDRLGFEVLDEYPGTYVRLKSPGSRSTIALHALDPGQGMVPDAEGLRLYFEVEDVDALCTTLAARGVRFQQMPEDMPWGWRHAYLRDPDGHRISLYHAGEARLKGTR